MLPRGVRGPVFENIVKGGFERKQTIMHGYSVLKELVEYHDCLKRKGGNVGIKKDS